MYLTLEFLSSLLETDVRTDDLKSYRYIPLKDDHILLEDPLTRKLQISNLQTRATELLSIKHLKGIFHGEPLRIPQRTK